ILEYVRRVYIKHQQKDGPHSLTNSNEKYIVIQGKAGSGKSTLIRAIQQMVTSMVARIADGGGRDNVLNNEPPPQPPPDVIRIAAPTGQAAINVGGQTIHSSFKIP